MGLMSMLGLISPARFAAVSERLRKSESRVETLTRKLEETQTELRAWRTKAEEAQKRAKDVEKEMARQAERAQKAEAQIEKRAVRDRKRIDVPTLEARLEQAHRDLAVARDHLMAVEVKLDILEGAAQVLDGRTRTLLAER